MYEFLLEKNFEYFGCNQALEIQSNIEIYEKKTFLRRYHFFWSWIKWNKKRLK